MLSISQGRGTRMKLGGGAVWSYRATSPQWEELVLVPNDSPTSLIDRTNASDPPFLLPWRFFVVVVRFC